MFLLGFMLADEKKFKSIPSPFFVVAIFRQGARPRRGLAPGHALRRHRGLPRLRPRQVSYVLCVACFAVCNVGCVFVIGGGVFFMAVM